MAPKSLFTQEIILPMDVREPGSQSRGCRLNSFSSKFIYIISSFVSSEGAKIQAVVSSHLKGVLEALETMRKT